MDGKKVAAKAAELELAQLQLNKVKLVPPTDWITLLEVVEKVLTLKELQPTASLPMDVHRKLADLSQVYDSINFNGRIIT